MEKLEEAGKWQVASGNSSTCAKNLLHSYINSLLFPESITNIFWYMKVLQIYGLYKYAYLYFRFCINQLLYTTSDPNYMT